MRFSDIPGLEETKNKLIDSVKNNHVAHAQLFLGKPGSANLSLALAFSTYLNCENPLDDACGTCPSCSKANKFIHPDIHFVFPVSPIEKKEGISQSFLTEWRKFLTDSPYGNEEDWSNYFGGENKQLNISKEESRQIIKNLSLKSFEGKYKIMVIWMAEYFHPSAANGILKILEEPPENTIFILVCNDHEKLLTTILSRTQVFSIRPFTDEEVGSRIQEVSPTTDAAKARQIASVASGNLNLAAKLLTDLEEDTHTVFRDWMRICFTKKYDVLAKWTDQFAGMSKTAQKSLIQYGINMLRESLIAQLNLDSLQKVTNEHENEFVKNFGVKALGNSEKIEKIYEELNTFLYHLERNINPKIAFLDSSLKINAIIKS